MASYELLGLNEATPQAVAPTAADTGVVSNLTVTTNLTATAGTASGVVYLNGSKVQTSGAGLQYDGGDALSVGVAAFDWNAHKAIDLGNLGAIACYNGGGGQTEVLNNAYANGAFTYYYKAAFAAGRYSINGNGVHEWSYAPAGSANAALTWAAVKTIDASGHWLPGTDNTQNLGSGSLRMAVLYAGTGTINTSDATEKTAVSALTASEIAAAKELALEIGSFQFLDSVERKGAENARHHIGMTVQRAIEVMESHGLEPFRYAFICYDEWDAETKEAVCDDGEFSREVTRQAIVETLVNYSGIEVINGVPTMVNKTRTDKEPQVQSVAVVDENGDPVIVDGEPLVHPVPVMETVTERYNVVTVREAGSRYGFRPDQLALFILRGLAA